MAWRLLESGSLMHDEPNEPAKDSAPPPVTRWRVLVADDHAAARLMLRELLTDEGYEVATAEDGRSAIAMLEAFAPDLVITDLSMPQLDGADFIVALRKMPRFAKVPAIVISAHRDASRRTSCLCSGASDYLSKPLNFDELLACVDRHLTRAPAPT